MNIGTVVKLTKGSAMNFQMQATMLGLIVRCNTASGQIPVIAVTERGGPMGDRNVNALRKMGFEFTVVPEAEVETVAREANLWH